MMNKCEKEDNHCRKEKMGCTGCAYNNGTVFKTKYKIGQKVWVADENREHKQIDLYSDVINGIFIDEKGEIWYFLSELCDDIREDYIINFDDTETLLKRIFEIDKQLNNE